MKDVKIVLLWLANFDSNFISDVWGDTLLAKHLKSKFEWLANYKIGYDLIMTFYFELSDNNQTKLINYIINLKK